MISTGIIGWRGMVGSVLLERMRAEDDFALIEPTFFSTSNAGGTAPDVGQGTGVLANAYDLAVLARHDVLISCQGGTYTKAVHPKLRAAGWDGLWIDAASALRMDATSTLVLDPLNGAAIRDALHAGRRDFVGANCTVSLMLMAMAGLFRAGHVQWMTSMTYQAASGAGAANMRELVAQMRALGDAAGPLLDDPSSAVLALDQRVATTLETADFPTAAFGAPLAASALPWIDSAVEGGRTREEWKAMVEANKILGRSHAPIPIDGLCVRIGAMRCHAQALTIKLDRAVPLDEIEAMIGEAHPWTSVVANDKNDTLAHLTPAAVAGTLQVPVGRVHTLAMGDDFLTAFTVGDQLLWGAAEPLRRTLRMVVEHRAG